MLSRHRLGPGIAFDKVVAGYLQYGLLKLQLLSNKRGFESSRGNEKLDGRQSGKTRNVYLAAETSEILETLSFS